MSKKQRDALAHARRIRGDIRLRVREALSPIPQVLLVQHDPRQRTALGTIARKVLALPEARVLEPTCAREAFGVRFSELWIASVCLRHPRIDTLDLARRIRESSPYVRLVACCRPDTAADLAVLDQLGVDPICEEGELTVLFESIMCMTIRARRQLPEILEVRAIAEELAMQYDDATIRALGYPPPARAQAVRPLQEVITGAVRDALRVAGGNRAEAARLLGIGRTRLYRILARTNEGA